MDADDVSDLFEPKQCVIDSVADFARFLKQFTSSHLVYPGNGKRNIGYIFRGEINFPVPLQPSLEREWFNMNSGNKCAVTELLAFEKILVERFMQETPEIRDLAMKHGDERTKLPCKTDRRSWALGNLGCALASSMATCIKH